LAFRFAEKEMGDSGREHMDEPSDLAKMSSKDTDRLKLSDARLKGYAELEKRLPKKGDMTEV